MSTSTRGSCSPEYITELVDGDYVSYKNPNHCNLPDGLKFPAGAKFVCKFCKKAYILGGGFWKSLANGQPWEQ